MIDRIDKNIESVVKEKKLHRAHGFSKQNYVFFSYKSGKSGVNGTDSRIDGPALGTLVSCRHATLFVAVSIRPSIRRSVGRSVSQFKNVLLWYFMSFQGDGVACMCILSRVPAQPSATCYFVRRFPLRKKK